MPGLYKNAPLKSASFEARFHGDLSIESRRGEFQRLVKSEFPHLYVPHAATDKAPALQHYQFKREDASASVMLALNSFVYTSTAYPGFDAFTSDIERLWEKFSSLFDVPAFTRLGLRYINNLPIIRSDAGAIPLSNYVTANLKVTPSLPSGTIYDLGYSVVCERDGGQMRILLQNEQSRDGVEVLLLDLDFSKKGVIERNERQRFIDSAHKEIETLFLELISPDYKQIMEGANNESK
jgi:uncharacterized protein (TIGR04255 family)